ncbi:hypothetical protein [Streptomyces sp. CA-253872]|uniref:hypothetical protein n=1 Tax=Streptomyces sp. CA-253872 TaxID=3240067 RepID=UPI003D8DF8AE
MSPARPPAPDLVVTVTPGTPAPDWCPDCKAYTRLAGSLVALGPTGVTEVGAYTWCEVCDDPDMPKETSRV